MIKLFRQLQFLKASCFLLIGVALLSATNTNAASQDVENEYIYDNYDINGTVCIADKHRKYYCGTCYIFFCGCTEADERIVDLGQVTGTTTSTVVTGSICRDTEAEATAALPVSAEGILIEVTGSVQTESEFCIINGSVL